MKDKYARQKKYIKENLVQFPLKLKPGIINQFRQVCNDADTNATAEIKKFIKKYTEENKTKKYFVDFGAGAGNEWADTIEEAMTLAVEGLSYTQETVNIYDGENIVATLPWYGIKPDNDDVITARFGDFGFYGEWIFI